MVQDRHRDGEIATDEAVQVSDAETEEKEEAQRQSRARLRSSLEKAARGARRQGRSSGACGGQRASMDEARGREGREGGLALDAQAKTPEDEQGDKVMASKRLHPLAETALRAAGEAGERAIKRAARDALTGAADSLLEELETSSGGLSAKAKEARDRLRDVRMEDTMAKKKKADEEEEEETESEEEEEEEEEEEQEGVVLLQLSDAECFIRSAYDLLNQLCDAGKVPRKLVRNLEDVHEAVSGMLEDADG
ncbi:MAG: hypothetical protein ACRD3M_03520 [Thermoanaerobaculia bacterium]